MRERVDSREVISIAFLVGWMWLHDTLRAKKYLTFHLRRIFILRMYSFLLPVLCNYNFHKSPQTRNFQARYFQDSSRSHKYQTINKVSSLVSLPLPSLSLLSRFLAKICKNHIRMYKYSQSLNWWLVFWQTKQLLIVFFHENSLQSDFRCKTML